MLKYAFYIKNEIIFIEQLNSCYSLHTFFKNKY